MNADERRLNFVKKSSGFICVHLWLAFLALGGCASQPIRMTQVHDVDLAAILIHWQDAVADAHNRTTVTWHHGWAGNAAVLADDHKNFGRCTDWQELAYLAVRDTARKLGYQVRMIRVNRGTLEHDAVAVFKLAPGQTDDLLFDRKFQSKVTILDGWKRGQADAWPLDRWLFGQQPMLGGLQIFDGDHEMDLRRARHDDLASRGFTLPDQVQFVK